jgi:hypothetical protein
MAEHQGHFPELVLAFHVFGGDVLAEIALFQVLDPVHDTLYDGRKGRREKDADGNDENRAHDTDEEHHAPHGPQGYMS